MKPLTIITLLVLVAGTLKAQKGDLFKEYKKRLDAYNKLCNTTTAFGYSTTVTNNVESTILFYRAEGEETEEALIVAGTCKIIKRKTRIVPITRDTQIQLIRVDTVYIKGDTIRIKGDTVRVVERVGIADSVNSNIGKIDDIKSQYSRTGFSVFKDNVLAAIVFYPLTGARDHYLLRMVKQNIAIADYSRDSKIFIVSYVIPISWWGNNFRGVLTTEMIKYMETSCQRFF